MHNGVFNELLDLVQFYNTRTVAAAEVTTNADDPDVGNPGLTGQEELDLLEFLKTLTDQ